MDNCSPALATHRGEWRQSSDRLDLEGVRFLPREFFGFWVCSNYHSTCARAGRLRQLAVLSLASRGRRSNTTSLAPAAPCRPSELPLTPWRPEASAAAASSSAEAALSVAADLDRSRQQTHHRRHRFR